MKIIHVVYSLDMGGAEVLVGQLCRVQRANGHEVSLCAYSQLGAVGEMLAVEGFAIFVPGEAHPARTMLRYLRHFRRLRPDVVHCHNPAPTLQAALPARLAGARCVVATRHSLVAPPYDRAAEIKFNLIARFCDWVVGICEMTCQNLRGTPLAETGKITRVYNGSYPVDIETVSGLETVDSEFSSKLHFTLLFVGRLAAIKNLEMLLRSVALAAQILPNVRLWIVGDGPVRAALESLSAELGISERVQFWGLRMETAGFFRAADCFAMSSVSEGLPMSLLQAMSAGLPAICTEVGGMAEVLRLSGSGLLVPSGDVSAYAAAIVQLATDRTLREQFSVRARAAYGEHFTLETMDAAYMELYQRR